MSYFRTFIQKFIATPPVKRWFFNKSGYCQYGLYHDDLIYETPEVQEAVRRLPQNLYDSRAYRIQRAHQLCLSHSILPKEEWTKFEDDLSNRYLRPYIDEVEKEKKEREMWLKAN